MSPNLIGQSLGRYHILEQLGEGGMATVYKAYDTRLERDVAVKVIRVDQFGQAVIDGILKRFEREAKALARLTHPNIVHINDYGEHEGVPFLVMDYLPGGTLKERMRQPMAWQAAAKLLLPVLSALEYAHEQKIVHRDIKPGNILLTQKGQPLLTDFGIAKLLETEAGQTLTGTGVGIGTPEYMAPEQGLGKHVDGRADLYSLGIVFYELVTGHKPYTADTPMAVIFKHLSDPLPAPRQFVPDLPESVERVLFKALAKQPENRYPDAQGFSEALEKLLQAPETPVLHPDTSQTVDWKLVDTPTQNPPAPAATSRPPTPAPLPPSQSPLPIPDFPTPNSQFTRYLKYWPLAAGLLCLSALVLIMADWLGNGGGAALFPMSTPASTATTTLTLTPMASQTPVPTATPRPTETTAPTATPHLTETPAFTSTPKPAKITDKGAKMALVPAGTFTMGSNANDALAECKKYRSDCQRDWFTDEEPPHQVALEAFYMDVYEVTNALYKACVEAGGCTPPQNIYHYNNSKYANHPVVYVDWNQAKTYCVWRGARLPTEAEWEYAARGSDGRTYPWGDGLDQTFANYEQKFDGTTEVGQFEKGKSLFGMYDMAGNVWEWVADWYDAYPGNTASHSDFGIKYRVLRGGSWGSNNDHIPSAFRYWSSPSSSSILFGFRCSRSRP